MTESPPSVARTAPQRKGDGAAGSASPPGPAATVPVGPQPTIGQELVAFIRSERARGVKRIRLQVGPRWCPRCLGDCDLPTQRYCKECRRKYRGERKEATILGILFHVEAIQSGLRALRDGAGRRRKRANTSAMSE